MDFITGFVGHPLTQTILIAGVVGLLFWVASLQRKLNQTHRFWQQLSRDANGGNLNNLLQQLYRHLEQVGFNLNQLASMQQELRGLYTQTVSKMGIMRFNPFSETGSDQSFAVAFLSEENSGIVISSLHAREGTRVYAKPIIHGKSHYQLTEEEKEVLREAMAKDTSA